MARHKAPSIQDDLLDQSLSGMDVASARTSPDWIKAWKKALTEQALSAKMDYHLDDDAASKLL